MSRPTQTPAASTPAAQPSGTENSCPECGWRLIDPEEMGYCPSCGFCRYVEAQRRQNKVVATPRNRVALRSFGEVIDGVAAIPGWLSILLGGAFAILLYAKAIDHIMPADSHPRAVIGLTMLLGGACVFFFAHFWVVAKITPQQHDLDLWELVSPVLIWQSALRRLPETCWPIWLGGWSCAMVLGSVFVLGGHAFWDKEPDDDDFAPVVAPQPSGPIVPFGSGNRN